MRVADVMETRVEAADVATTAEDAWEQMRRRNLAWLIVTDAGHIVGMVARGSLGGPDEGATRRDRTLAQYLPYESIAIPAEYPVSRAAAMLEGDVSGCVAVLDRGRLVGVLTMSGLLHRLAMHESRLRAS